MSRRIITTVATSGLIALSVFCGAGPAIAQSTDFDQSSITLTSELDVAANQTPNINVTPDSGSQTAGSVTPDPSSTAAQTSPVELSPKEKELVDSIMTPEERAQLEKEKRDFGTAVLAAVMAFALLALTAGVLISRSIRGRKINEAQAAANDSETVGPEHTTSS